jgi:hypothetical protein
LNKRRIVSKHGCEPGAPTGSLEAAQSRTSKEQASEQSRDDRYERKHLFQMCGLPIASADKLAMSQTRDSPSSCLLAVPLDRGANLNVNQPYEYQTVARVFRCPPVLHSSGKSKSRTNRCLSLVDPAYHRECPPTPPERAEVNTTSWRKARLGLL